MSGVWTGKSKDGDAWEVECETDRFSGRDPFVVSLDVRYEAPDGEKGGGLAMLSPQQARELANALLREAENVAYNNTRPEIREELGLP